MASTNVSISKQKEDAFAEQIQSYVYAGFINLGLAIGSQCGLFDKMIEVNEPLTPHQLAEKTSCKRRYVEEWLRMMASGGIVDFKDQGEDSHLFYLQPHKHTVLKGYIYGAPEIPLLAAPHTKLVSCFSSDGPRGLEFEDTLPSWNNWMKMMKPQFFRDYVDGSFQKIPGLEDQLKAGIQLLDIGCGEGQLFPLIASKYPNSTFTGIDICEESIAKAKANNSDKNVSYVVQDCAKLPDSWKGKFDVVTMVEVFHDLPLPKESLDDACKVCKSGGYFSCVEMNLDSDLKAQVEDSFNAVIFYAYSLYFCLTLSLTTEGSAGLGTCFGKQKTKAMIEDSGFTNSGMLEIQNQPCYLHFLNIKDK